MPSERADVTSGPFAVLGLVAIGATIGPVATRLTHLRRWNVDVGSIVWIDGEHPALVVGNGVDEYNIADGRVFVVELGSVTAISPGEDGAYNFGAAPYDREARPGTNDQGGPNAHPGGFLPGSPPLESTSSSSSSTGATSSSDGAPLTPGAPGSFVGDASPTDPNAPAATNAPNAPAPAPAPGDGSAA